MTIPRLPLLYQGSSLGVPYEDVSFKTRTDNLTLKGWFLPGANSQVIIVIHGGFQNRIDDVVDTKDLAPALVGRGYNVLLFDLRGRGESEGVGHSLSDIDADVGGAVDYVKSRGFPAKDICLLGFCSGAAQSCIYSSRNHDVGAVILDGCFTDVGTMVARQAESIDLPGWAARAFTPGATLWAGIIYGFHRVDPVNVVPEIQCPVLFIHEQLDEFTTTAETQHMLHEAANPQSDFFEIPGAKHSEGFHTYPQQYVDAVDVFLKKLDK